MAADSLAFNVKGNTVNNTNLPLDYLDEMINEGTLCLFDISRTDSYANQANPANGTIIKNLVEGGPNATVVGNSTTFANGALVLPGLSSNYINMGDNYNMVTLGNPDFGVSIWTRQDSDYSTAQYQGLIGRMTGTAVGNMQWGLDLGSTGLRTRANVGSNTAVHGAIENADHATGVPIHYYMASEGGITKLHRNGVLVFVSGSALTKPYANVAGNVLIGTSPSFQQYKGRVYRWSIENLTLSGKTAAAQALAEYNANVYKFS